MHRYSKPYRCYTNMNCAYRRKRKTGFPFISVCFVIMCLVLVCIIPLWLTCALLGAVMGFLICLVTRRN